MTTEEINKHDERELLLDSIRDFNEREYIPRQELLKQRAKAAYLLSGVRFT